MSDFVMGITVPLEKLVSKIGDKFCHCCQEPMDGVGCCDNANWFMCCTSCSAGLTACPHCKKKSCRMLPVGKLTKDQLKAVFEVDDAYIADMNQSMYIEFDVKTVKVGVLIKPFREDENMGPSRGGSRSAAPAISYVKDGEGFVELLEDEEFVLWSVERRTVAELCAGVNMGRSVKNDDDTHNTRVLGSALHWAHALLYKDSGDGYPTLVGRTTSGREVLIALACNPNLPGFLLWAYNPENAQTLVSPVDIPAKVWGDKPTVNDSRVKVLSNKHVGGDARVLSLRVYDTMTRKVKVPTVSRVDANGCLYEEYAVERVEMALELRSLTATEVYAQHVGCSGVITPEGLKSLKSFWSSLALLGTELDADEDHEGWELLVPGPDGCNYPIYKVVYKYKPWAPSGCA